jgi:hypothetical protein
MWMITLELEEKRIEDVAPVAELASGSCDETTLDQS